LANNNNKFHFIFISASLGTVEIIDAITQ